MSRAFANISFTPDVKSVQSLMGSRHNYQQFEIGDIEQVQLSDVEKQFIEQRDSFYQATVSSNGWPYVQHRGGPTGFIKIIDDQMIGYADFTGNRQYISVGNLKGDDRISLILMDYQQQRRLKIWGRVSIVDDSKESALLSKLEPENSRAPVERGILIKIEAFDWNCPKYITPRFTQHDVELMMAEISPQVDSKVYDYKGVGELPIVITAIEQLTDEIRRYRLRHRHNEALPSYQAGAHITVPVQLASGRKTTRSYSLINIHKNTDQYEIAIKLDKSGHGGSTAVHQHWQVGTKLNIDPPKNYFSLVQNTGHTLLIAGGIGITPIMAMAEELKQRHASFELHYTSQTRQTTPFLDKLVELYETECHLYFSREKTSTKLDIHTLITTATPNTHIYICGPDKLLKQALTIAEQLGPTLKQRIHFESFL